MVNSGECCACAEMGQIGTVQPFCGWNSALMKQLLPKKPKKLQGSDVFQQAKKKRQKKFFC